MIVNTFYRKRHDCLGPSVKHLLKVGATDVSDYYSGINIETLKSMHETDLICVVALAKSEWTLISSQALWFDCETQHKHQENV